MPFGLGFAELIVALLLLLGASAVLFLLAARLISKGLSSGRNSPRQVENQQLAAELQQAQLRIEELEEKVARVTEKAGFTQDLPGKPRTIR